MKSEIVDIEKAYLQNFLNLVRREPTSRELVVRARGLAENEIEEMERIISEMFDASAPLVLANQTIMAEMKDACRSSIRRFGHFISREYTKEEFDNLPKPAQADMKRMLKERKSYYQSLIDRYGKY